MSVDDVHQLTTSEALTALCDPTASPVLHRHPYIQAYSFWGIVPINDLTMKHVALTHQVCATPTQGHQHQPGKWQAVSIGQIVPVYEGFRYTMFYYGDSPSDMVNHVRCHMVHCYKTLPEGSRIVFSLLFPDHFHDSSISTILEPLFKRQFLCVQRNKIAFARNNTVITQHI